MAMTTRLLKGAWVGALRRGSFWGGITLSQAKQLHLH